MKFNSKNLKALALHTRVVLEDKKEGITLVSLVVTIILLLILAGVSIGLISGSNGILGRASEALESNDQATATEKIEMKITYFNVISYGENTRKANLQELAEGMFQDKEIEYVKIKENKVASLDKIDVTGEKSIFVKLKEYPYEFEISSDLQLASIDHEEIKNNNNSIYKLGTYTSVGVSAGLSLWTRMREANTIEINVKEKYKDYEKLTVNNFIAMDELVKSVSYSPVKSGSMNCATLSTQIISYDSNLGILKIIKPFFQYDHGYDSYDYCGTGSTTIYIVENAEIPEL